MKKALFAIAVALLFIATSTYSQSMKDFTWDSYNVKFSIPTTFQVDKSTGSEFQAGNEGVYLSIYPKTGNSVAFNQMKQKLEDWAVDAKFMITRKYMSLRT